MSPENESALSSTSEPARRVDRVDLITRIVFWVLLVAVLGTAAFFGYTVYETRRQQMLADPARRAVENLRGTVRQKPNDAYARVRLAEAMAQAGMYDESVVELKAALQIDPKYVGAYEDLALVAGKKQDYASAEAYLRKVLELTVDEEFQNVNDRRELAYFYLGEIAIKQKHYEDAVGYLKQALLIRRDASDTYVLLAQAYIAMGDNDQALKQLTVAIAYDPNFPEARYEIGKLLLGQGNKPAAAESFRKALNAKSEFEPAQQALEALGPIDKWMQQAKDAFAKKDHKSADEAVRVARSIDPENLDALRLSAAISEAKGDKKAAAESYKEILKLKPNDQDVVAALKRLGEKVEGAAQ